MLFTPHKPGMNSASVISILERSLNLTETIQGLFASLFRGMAGRKRLFLLQVKGDEAVPIGRSGNGFAAGTQANTSLLNAIRYTPRGGNVYVRGVQK